MKNRICRIVALLSLFALLLSIPTLAMAATLSHQYDEVEGYGSSLVEVKKGKKVGLIDAVSIKVIFPAEYDFISSANGGYRIVKDEKVGYADPNGKIIIPCKYRATEIEDGYDGEPILAREGDKLCLLDAKTGELVATSSITPQYFSWFKNGMAQVIENKKYGLIDNTGKLVVPCIYERIDSFDIKTFKGELTAAKKDGRWGFIDKKGKVVIPFEYEDQVYSIVGDTICDDKMRVKKNGKWGIINMNGQMEIPCKYDSIGDFNYGLAPAKIGYKYVYINMQGKIVLAGDYDKAEAFKNGVAKVTKRDSTYMINTKGEKVNVNVNQTEFHDGLCVVAKFVKEELRFYYGYANEKMKLVIPYDFDEAYDFENGMALVKLGEKWGYIDTNGNWIIYREFDEEFRFSSAGVAKVLWNGKWGLLTKDGDYVLPCEYDSLYCCDEVKRVFTVKNGYMNVWDLEGNKIF